jgi:hemerythrin
MTLVDPDLVPLVVLPFMDEDHLEEARLLNALGEALAAMRSGEASVPAVAESLASLYAHVRAHSEREEAAMQQGAFPLLAVHRAEHERALADLTAEGERFAQTGAVRELWTFASVTWPAWSGAHIRSLDVTAARYLTAADA